MSAGVLDREGYLAGTDSRRRAELESALSDNSAKAILATRGGYGALRIATSCTWSDLERSPKWIVGSSDITTLHVMAWRKGIASLHAPNLTGLTGALPIDRAAWIRGLERGTTGRNWRGLTPLCSGRAQGVIVGGNLSLLSAMAAAGHLWIPKGAIFAFEDVGEAPYRIDRMLTSLRLGGHLDRIAGFVIGDLDGNAPGRGGRTADEVVGELLRPFGVPVVAGAPFGHGTRNEAFAFGATVRIDEDALYFS